MKRRWMMAASAAAVMAATLLPARGQDTEPAATTEPAYVPLKGKIAPDQLSDAQVMNAINGGVNYLLKQLDQYEKKITPIPDTLRGTSGEFNDDELGRLMLMVYTLLYVGEDTGDPRLHFRTDRMKIALDVVLQWDGHNKGAISSNRDTYSTSLQALALAQLPPTDQVKAAMTRVATRLIGGVKPDGGYGYHLDAAANEAHWDRSNSQYALLGMWAAADWGSPVEGDFWKNTDHFWRAGQNSDGGWGYTGTGNTTYSMTAAGVASLLVCDEFLNRTPQLNPPVDTAKERGMEALTAAFKPESTNYYALYGVERASLAGGIKYLGKINWYRAAAVDVMTHQQDDGSFDGGDFYGADGIVNTCYCLLFLARGRAPVLMNKLQYPGVWNARPRDSANVHAYLSKAFERHLNWQIESIDAPADDWLDAPIMLITGSKAPAFTDEDVAKLKAFVDAGGIIFSTADGASKDFTEAMQKYAEAVGGGQYKWRELPKDHPLYTIYGRAQHPLPLFGVSNGIRELWIHSPEDLGAVWQAREMVQVKGVSQPPEKNKEAWDVPARLFFYAASRAALRSKLEPLTVPAPKTPPVRTVRVARVKFAGNWDPEPGAWPRFSKLMANEAHTNVAIDVTDGAGIGKLAERPSLAHLAGVGKLQVTPADEAGLKDFVNSGGTLFVEAMGGDATFAADGQALLRKLFPQGKLAPIPRTYTLYTGAFSPDAGHIGDVEYRKSWALEHGQQTAPRLKFMTINDRMAVVFSAEDVTSGLLGTDTWGVGGYMPDSAMPIARNLVLFAGVNDVHRPSEGK
ncbi:MAG TPA: DUF4159 domain-containing protein [Phycisphaerae bacterium]|nr:DUF4159 domain-containing protein [Phycisphaerae bacterium]